VVPERLRRLRHALALVFGAEAVVVTATSADSTPPKPPTCGLGRSHAAARRLTETYESDTNGPELLSKGKEVDG
jgi:hypothetical protein